MISILRDCDIGLDASKFEERCYFLLVGLHSLTASTFGVDKHEEALWSAQCRPLDVILDMGDPLADVWMCLGLFRKGAQFECFMLPQV